MILSDELKRLNLQMDSPTNPLHQELNPEVRRVIAILAARCEEGVCVVVAKQLIKERWEDADAASFEKALARAVAEEFVEMAPNGYILTTKGIARSRQ
jgi:hypothetical protein